MSAALDTAALPHRPDPTPDPVSAPAPIPSGTSRVLGLLHKLIDYGKGVARALHQRVTPTSVPAPSKAVARQFGTMNILLILSRIVRGLRLAAALEARLVHQPVRQEAEPAPVRAPSARTARPAEPSAPRAERAASPLPLIPTAEEIAAALRHRSAGAVIVDICLDLGIVPSHPLWHEVMFVVTEFGGNFVTLFKETMHRVCAWFADPSMLDEHGWPAPGSPLAAAYSTGPP